MAETTELKKSDFYFDLPQELIAQDPLEDRSSSRLLVLDKNTGDFLASAEAYRVPVKIIFNKVDAYMWKSFC